MWHAVYFNNVYVFPALFVRLNQDWQEEWMARHNNWHNRHVIYYLVYLFRSFTQCCSVNNQMIFGQILWKQKQKKLKLYI